MLMPIMEKEVKNLLDAKIIIPLRYSEWVAVITLNCTIHAYLASGHLRSLLCQSTAEQLFKNPLL
jgi:hypothetical protein